MEVRAQQGKIDMISTQVFPLRAPVRGANGACLDQGLVPDSHALCADPVCKAGTPHEAAADSSQRQGEG